MPMGGVHHKTCRFVHTEQILILIQNIRYSLSRHQLGGACVRLLQLYFHFIPGFQFMGNSRPVTVYPDSVLPELCLFYLPLCKFHIVKQKV